MKMRLISVLMVCFDGEAAICDKSANRQKEWSPFVLLPEEISNIWSLMMIRGCEPVPQHLDL